MDYKKSKAPTNTVTRDLMDFCDATDNIYESVAIIGKRANQIAQDIKQEHAGLHQLPEIREDDPRIDGRVSAGAHAVRYDQIDRALIIREGIPAVAAGLVLMHRALCRSRPDAESARRLQDYPLLAPGSLHAAAFDRPLQRITEALGNQRRIELFICRRIEFDQHPAVLSR